MALIKFTVSELEEVKSQISKISSKASDCASQTASVRNNLDMEISAKRNIEEHLDSIKRDLTKHSESLKSCANILNDVINDFTREDSKSNRTKSTNWTLSSEAPFSMPFSPHPACTAKLGTVDWPSQMKLLALASARDMFGGTSAAMTSTDKISGESVPFPLEKIDDAIKTGKDVASLWKTITSIFNNGDPTELAKKFDDLKIFSAYGYISDVKKAIEATIDSDMDALTGLLKKYGIKRPLKEIVKTTVGGTSAEVGLITNLIYSDFESAIDVSKEIGQDLTQVILDPNSNLFDYVKVISELNNAPNKIITQGFINVIGDYADSFGGILGFFGLEDVPEEGYVETYKGYIDDIKDMYAHFGVKDATSCLVKGFKQNDSDNFNEMVDNLVYIGEGISGFFKSTF